MEASIEQILSDHPSLSGSLILDSNGLLVSSRGDLDDLKSAGGSFTAISRALTSLNELHGLNSQSSSVTIECQSGVQLMIKKSGELTVVLGAHP